MPEVDTEPQIRDSNGMKVSWTYDHASWLVPRETCGTVGTERS